MKKKKSGIAKISLDGPSNALRCNCDLIAWLIRIARVGVVNISNIKMKVFLLIKLIEKPFFKQSKSA